MAEAVDFQIIANFMAGKGTGRRILSDLEIFLKNHDKTFDVLAVEMPTPISLLPGHNFKINRAVICIGGDGTVSESVGYILNKQLDLPLAVIPAGTANIIAASLGIAGQKYGFNFLLEERRKKINIGLAQYGNEKDYFLLGLGLGFEEIFLKTIKEKMKTRLGVLSYIFAAFSDLLNLEKIPVKISFEDGQISSDICALMVLNMAPKVLKCFPLFKKNNFYRDASLLDLSYVEYKNWFQAFLGTLALHIMGSYNFGLVKTFSKKEFYLESLRPAGTQLDGELKGNLPVKLSLLPLPFSFLV